MNEFIESFESKGIKNIKNLAFFVQNFRKKPAIFFDLTETKRKEMEQKLDEALVLFKDQKQLNLTSFEFKRAQYA